LDEEQSREAIEPDHGEPGKPLEPRPEPVLGPPPRRVPVGLRLLCLFGGPTGCAWGLLFFGWVLGAGSIEAAATLGGLMRILAAVGVVVWCLAALMGARGVVDGFREGSEACHFLAHGKLATGRVKGHESPWQRTYVVTLAFTDEAGTTHETSIRTHKWALCDPSHPILLLYDPADVPRVVAVGDLPHEPEFDGTGGFRRPRWWDVAGSLGFPLLTLIVPGGWLVQLVVRLVRSVLY
jgi:hypothetical protein